MNPEYIWCPFTLTASCMLAWWFIIVFKNGPDEVTKLKCSLFLSSLYLISVHRKLLFYFIYCLLSFILLYPTSRYPAEMINKQKWSASRSKTIWGSPSFCFLQPTKSWLTFAQFAPQKLSWFLLVKSTCFHAREI